MMQATERAVRAPRLDDMIDFEPVGFSVLAILRVRAPERLVPAPLASIFVAAFYGSARERPPVVLPKRIRTRVAAPRAAPLRQLVTAPRAAGAGLIRQVARRK